MWRRHKSDTPKSTWSQVRLPSHLSEWPMNRSSPMSMSRPQQRTRNKLAGSSEKKENNRNTCQSTQQNAETREGRSKNFEIKTLSLGDGNCTSMASNLDEESQYDSAAGALLTQESRGSNPVRDVQKNGYSTGDEGSPTDESDHENKVKGTTSDASNAPPTPAKGTKERKEKMRQATASQKIDKSKGKQKKKHNKTDQPTNVFNAHSPKKEDLKSSNPSKNATLTASKRSDNIDALFATSPESGSKIDYQSRLKRESEEQHSSPAMLLIKGAQGSKEVPVLPQSSPPPNQPEHLPQSIQTRQNSPKFCAATTEAQLQARLLRKGGHREFFSKACTPPGEKNASEDGTRLSSSKKKKRKRRSKMQHDSQSPPDLVKNTIAKERARLQEHIAKKMKANPNHYKDVKGKITMPTPEDLLRSDDEHTNHTTSRTSFNGWHLSGASQGTKRKRDGDDNVEHALISSVSRKKSKRSDQVKSGTTEDHEQQTSAMGRRTTESTTKPKNDKESSLENIRTSQSDLFHSRQTASQNPEVPLSAYRRSVDNVQFKETLKSLWTMIPKSLLYETMKKLNKEHCKNVGSRLRHCRKGRENIPNVRIVTKEDDKGDMIDYLEENGKIIEPKPHTMSSDLTILTAARDLIVMLSGQSPGVDLHTLTVGVKKPKGGSHNNQAGNSVREQPGETSQIQSHLNRIAAERQREIERLREENRRLAAKMEKTKKRSK